MNIVLMVGLAIVGGLLIVLVDALVRRPVAATRLVLLAVVLGTIIVDPRFVSIEVAGFLITVEDVVFSLVAAAAAVRLLPLTHTSPQQKALTFLIGMLILSLLMGVVEFGLAPAVNEFRGYLGYAGAALYFSTVALDDDLREALSREWMWAGIALGGVVVLRWLARFGGFGLGPFDGSTEQTLRVVNGPDTLTIATIGLVLLLPGISQGIRRLDRRGQVGSALLLISVMLNRRTLWLALAIAVFVFAIRQPRLGRRLTTFAATGVILFAVMVPLLTSDGADNIAESAANVDNLGWRVDGWRALLESGPDRFDEYLIGLPFGTGYEREVRGTELRGPSPHNYYLQAFLRTGVLGTLFLLFALALTISTLWQRVPSDDGRPFASEHLLALLVMQAVWLLAWSPLAEQGVILGMGIASATYGEYVRTGAGAIARAPTPDPVI